ncbi:hypothetical protein [Gaoshiqia sediminis]|uniref:Uncharacterized protein n=1 Tax=Gaoshiqia sediminis TaxID=2986998 RepID=A0AA41YEP0_9BACT|nr:hypothetical protein [Gaoshiqia sediminis]MCW0484542.1 hypothetical protein [Gaoshiqia sediminis]
MAKVKGGLLGSVAGKLGPLVVVQRGETTYVRSAPVFTKDSWSEKQQKNRQRFREVNAFCRRFKQQVIVPVWNKLAEGKSGYHLFLKANSPAFGQDGSIQDISLLRFADGKLPQPFQLKAQRSGEDAMNIQVSWQNDGLSAALRLQDELLYMTAETDQFQGIFSSGIQRSQGGGVIRLPEGTTAERGIYLFFAAPDRAGFSPDRYVAL